MSYESATTAGLPFPVRVELASLGDGLGRWIRLRLLWKKTLDEGGGEDLAALGKLLDEALTEAEADAKAIVSAYTANAEAINAFAASLDPPASAGEKVREKLTFAAGDDPAQTVAARAQRFLDAGGADRERVSAASADASLFEIAPDQQFCDAVFPKMLVCWAACGDGVEAACGSIWGEMYERWC